MDVPIRERRLTSLTIWNASWGWDPGGVHMISATCSIHISAADGSDQGPGVNVFFGLPYPVDGSIQDAERALLVRVHEVLTKLASLSVDELERQFSKDRKEILEPQ